MNTIRLEVDKKYNFYLENIYISSKVYDEENRDVFTNSYSLSFNISLQDKEATKLFNYLQTNKSSFQNVKFEDCKLYVNEDLLSETITFTLIEVAGNSFNCFILLNEYNKILLFNNSSINQSTKLNELKVTSTLSLYSGSTTMRNPIPSTLNAKFIMNNNYNYNGTDNYLTINKDLEISEEDLVFNFNVAGLLRSYLLYNLDGYKSFTSLDNDYFFKIDKVELNYNTIYNKVANSGVTISEYNGFKYDSTELVNNDFEYKNFRTEADTFTRLEFNTVETDYDQYRYSYFKNDYYNKIFYLQHISGIINVPTFILAKETMKYVNLPIVNQSNINNTLPNKFNFIINNDSFNESIFFNSKNNNSLIIPSYNDYLINFNYNLDITNILARGLKPSSQYDIDDSLYLSQNVYNNMAIFALGFENSANNDKIENIFNYIYNSFINVNDPQYSFTGKTYETLILDEYLSDEELKGMDNLVFFKVVYDINLATGGNKFIIRKYVTKKLYDFNTIDFINKIDDIQLPLTITLIDRNDDLNIVRSNIKLFNGNIDFDILYDKDNEIKEIKPLYIFYDDSGYIVPASNLSGWTIGSSSDIGQTAVFNRQYNISINTGSTINMQCYYLIGEFFDNNFYSIPQNLLPPLSLTEFLKELCIIKGCYIYYDNNYIDLKPFSDYYLLKNYYSFQINKLSEYKNPFFLENKNYWITDIDESNIYSEDLSIDENNIYFNKTKYKSFFKYTVNQNRIYNTGSTTTFDTLQLSSPERYNKSRITYDSNWSPNIDGVRDSYDGFYLFKIEDGDTIDDNQNNNDGKTVKFVNKLNTFSEETIFSPKNNFSESNIYKAGNYNIFFGNEYKSKFEASIKIPYHIWKECKNRPILIEDDGVKYIVFEIEQYNISTEICTIKGIKS